MIALWNRSLAVRFVAIILVALAISQGIGVLLFMNERDEALYVNTKREFLSRCASLAKVLESTPPSVHGDILRASDTNYSRFWISPEFPSDSAGWIREAKTRLARPLPSVARIANGDTGADADGAVVDIPAGKHAGANLQWTEMPAYAWPLSRPAKFLRLNGHMGMGLSVQLQDGTWLNTVFAKNTSDGFWTSRSAFSLGMMALILAIGTAYVARSMTRPMRRLAASAEALGRGETVEPLPETGPDDVRQTAEAFNLMQARLHRFVEDRTRTLAAIGHDLRTPLTSLRLRAEFIPDDEMREKMLGTIDELRSMTEAALTFSSAEAVKEETRNVDLVALVESLCDDLVEVGYDVSFKDGEKIGYRCRGDALKRAIRNLIENAVRYGERARVSIFSTASSIEIRVEDDGPGIPADKLNEVFSPFFRLETSRNRETGGIGLGLSIARDVVRQHGGDVQLTNTGRGLRATLTLPLTGARESERAEPDATGRRWRKPVAQPAASLKNSPV